LHAPQDTAAAASSVSVGATTGDDLELGPGAVTWEGSFVLCAFVETCCELEALVGLKCLELGAGASTF